MNEENKDLQELEKKIDDLKESQKENTAVKNISAGAEFIAPILGGLAIGYYLDQWLDTKPAFIISLFLLGVGAGFLNIYKASQNIGSSVGFSELHQRESNVRTSREETKYVDED